MTRSRPRWLRALAAAAVLLAAPVTVYCFWVPSEAAGFVALAVLGISPIVAMPLFRGHWDRDAFAVQGFFTVLLLAIYAAIAVLAVDGAWDALAAREMRATPAEESAVLVLMAAESVLLAALVCATVPVAVSRRVLVRVVGVLAVLGFGTAGAAVAIAGSDPCERFVFDQAAWQHDPEPVADGLVRCGTLDGLTEGELRQLGLVPRGSHGTIWLGESLYVKLDGDGRVRSAHVDDPADEPWMD